MQQAIFTFMFLASAPIGLMPAIVALVTRHKHRLAIAALNLATWGLGYFSIRGLIDPQAQSFLVPVPVFGLAWLALGAWSFRGASRAKSQTGA
jgi:hypothetical protein